jgi:hypothetical protein
MDAIQENKVSMFFKVRLYFANHLTFLVALIPALGAAVGTFNTKLDQLGTLDQTATEANDGYATQKDINRKDMRDKAMIVANGVKAYAITIADAALQAKAEIVKTSLDMMRDTDILYWCENMISIANPLATQLVAMGVTATKLTAFVSATAKFKQVIQAPADQRSESEAAGIGVDLKIIEIDASLELIDAFMETQRQDQAQLYNKYQGDRGIDDNATGSTKADVTITIQPGFTKLYNVPYLAGRRFKVSNLSQVPLNYSLSNAPDSFTGNVNLLAASSQSTKLSSNLNIDGEWLVAENVNAVPMDILVWVIE